MIIRVAQNQTIWDIALQYAGSIEAALDILEANGKANTTLFVGEELIVPAVLNRRIANFFESESSVATSIDPLGVDTWVAPPPACLPAYYQWFLNGSNIGSGNIPSGEMTPVALDGLIPETDYNLVLNGNNLGSGSLTSAQLGEIVLDGLIPETGYDLVLNGANLGSGSLTSAEQSDIILDAFIPDANYQLTLNGWNIESGSITPGTTDVIAIDDYANNWIRNPFWPAIPNTADRAFIVWAVFADELINGVELTLNAQMIIDWGDGSTSNSGTATRTKSYTYSAITAPVLQAHDGRTYKPVLITINRNGGQPNDFIINETNNRPNNALEIEDRLTVSGNNKKYRLSPTDPQITSTSSCAFYLERVKLNSTCQQTQSGFVNANRVRVFDVPVNFLQVSDSVAWNNFFRGSFDRCQIGASLTSSGAFNSNFVFSFTGRITVSNIALGSGNVSGFFENSSVESIGNFTSTGSGSNTTSIFRNTRRIKSIGTISLPNATNVSSLFQNSSVRSVVFSNCASFTTLTNLFDNTGNISDLIMPGLTRGVNVSGNKLQVAALELFFLLLGNASGTQIINIARNPGATTCDISIAQTKGFTVITV